METGELGILNVGSGDTKLSFDNKNPVERERAARIVTDMLKRGFAIMVQVGEKGGKPLYQRAEAFDPDTCEYIIFGDPEPEQAGLDDGPPIAEAPRGKPRGRPRKIRVPASDTHAVSVARSAGG